VKTGVTDGRFTEITTDSAETGDQISSAHIDV